jgi:hypothetical protein
VIVPLETLLTVRARPAILPEILSRYIAALLIRAMLRAVAAIVALLVGPVALWIIIVRAEIPVVAVAKAILLLAVTSEGAIAAMLAFAVAIILALLAIVPTFLTSLRPGVVALVLAVLLLGANRRLVACFTARLGRVAVCHTRLWSAAEIVLCGVLAVIVA